VNPLERLFEREGLPAFGLPPALAVDYGGDFGLARPELYANFVSSVDGVVAQAGAGESGRVISGDNEPDCFIMGLLRAAADAVVIGAGTFRKTAGDRWYPESVYPAAGELFAELRKQLHLRPHPLLVIISASGQIDSTQLALHDCLVITTLRGESRLRGTLPSGARIAVLGAGRIGGRSLLEFLHAQGLKVVLTEGGPSLVGQLLAEGLINELFLTTSPRLFGREAGDERKSLVEGVNLGGRSIQLSSVRRHDSHLYLRYSL
jgi:riboflavin biosynthesis pyrimidine reductase